MARRPGTAAPVRPIAHQSLVGGSSLMDHVAHAGARATVVADDLFAELWERSPDRRQNLGTARTRTDP